ncbi:phage holin family protein [Gryllotalpicola protaetiae]|uniref:Phage holin family protein n=1 Tax=Gryllotalpicola protaetiae TaxID=2419771 RepID=A0A387BLL1_9MICO|nr:phage holin family protein [Gryllotalpicola protaetiae]AYG03518.1 phage holin family protein [Gryllotalpicola protaetiae]
MRFVVKLLINAFALWLTTLIVAGVHVTAWDTGSGWALFWTYIVLALVFGIVNGIVGTVLRIVAFPLYILTLGLFSLIVNGLLLLVVEWISDHWLRFGLTVDGFWWGVLGALVLGVISWIVGLIFRPLTSQAQRR